MATPNTRLGAAPAPPAAEHVCSPCSHRQKETLRERVCRKHRFLEASQRGERHDSSPAAEQEAALQGTRAAAPRAQELGQRGAVPHGAEAAWPCLQPSCLRHRRLPSASPIPTSQHRAPKRRSQQHPGAEPAPERRLQTRPRGMPSSSATRPQPLPCSVQPGQTPAALRGRLGAGERSRSQLSAPIPSLLSLHPTERVSSHQARARNWDSARDAAAPFPDTDPTGRMGREGNSRCHRQPPSTSGRQRQGEGALPPVW